LTYIVPLRYFDILVVFVRDGSHCNDDDDGDDNNNNNKRLVSNRILSSAAEYTRYNDEDEDVKREGKTVQGTQTETTKKKWQQSEFECAS